MLLPAGSIVPLGNAWVGVEARDPAKNKAFRYGSVAWLKMLMGPGWPRPQKWVNCWVKFRKGPKKKQDCSNLLQPLVGTIIAKKMDS